jgi:thymidylate synthase ThyX
VRVYLQKFDNQEVQARCCALFARSPKPLDEQAAKATAEQAQAFARTYVVGYGHNSINDCGSVCAAVERVSILAAKFVEDHPLFNGQETSTRVIDFGAAPDAEALVSPFLNGDVRLALQRDLMAFYREAVPVQRAFIAAENGIDLGSAGPAALRAVGAKSFDILRGFLPAGCRTQLAWVTTFRQAAERVEMMLRHPLGEMREIGLGLREACLSAHPGAFHGLEKASHIESADAWYTDEFWAEYHTPLLQVPNTVRVPPRGFGSARYAGRPASKRVPPLADLRSEEIEIVQRIDYGSWRDIHRHRNCTQAFPLLTSQEFEPFYVENLAPGLRGRAEGLVDRAMAACRTGDRLLDQYAIPMGFMVTYWAKWSVSQAAYVLELRSRPTVHPTVRAMVRRIADAVTAVDGCPEINCDWSEFPYTRKVKV